MVRNILGDGVDIEGLKLKEIGLFLDLAKTRSIRELARQRGELPGQISKAIRSLELKLGNTLIHRSAQGVSLTAYATEVLPYLEGIRSYQLRLDGHFDRSERQTVLSFATTSFFSSHFVPSILGQLEKEAPDVHCRLIDLPPNQFVPVALRNGFDVCIHLKDLEWPRTWSSIEVGQVRWLLCGRSDHPLAKRTSLEKVLAYPFVSPIYWTSEGLRNGDDQFPIPLKKRMRGFETATATSAASVVSTTNHLGFLPNLVAQPLIREGLLKHISVPNLKSVNQPVYLTVKSDVVKQQRFLWIQQQCQRLLLAEQ